MVLARDRERARRRREGSRGRVVDFQGRQRLHTVRSTNQQDAPVAQQRGGVSAAGRAHGGEGGECVAGGIEQLGRAAIADSPLPARDQDGAVVEPGGRVTPDRRRQRRREQRVRPRGGVVDRGRGQALAGRVPAAGERGGAVCL